MVVVQASKLALPRSSLSSPHISSLLFEPHSLSLALMHPDSTFSLYPSLSPLSTPPPPPPLPTFISPPSSSASFLLLRSQNPSSNSHPRVLFVVAGPHEGGASLVLRFWILRRKIQGFVKARVVCSQKDLQSQDGLGVVVNVRHGVSIKLAGSTNYFAMYSISNSKIWVFAVKMEEENGDGDGDSVVLKLMKCAVVECSRPVWAISISFGTLILGEEKGVRVLPLRPLVKRQNSSKGRLEKVKEVQVENFPNGVIQVINETNDHAAVEEQKTEKTPNGYLERKSVTHKISVKLDPQKLGQDVAQEYAHFVPFRVKEVGNSNGSAFPTSPKAVSIQALCANKFLILDSVGDLHLLCLSKATSLSESNFHMRQLTQVMQVRKLSVLPGSSTRAQVVWVSDGLYSVHIMRLSESELSVDGNERNGCKEMLMQSSVNQAIFSSEKIQDVVPLAADAILILGQGEISVYAIS